jgi:hypothetical protein
MRQGTRPRQSRSGGCQDAAWNTARRSLNYFHAKALRSKDRKELLVPKLLVGAVLGDLA